MSPVEHSSGHPERGVGAFVLSLDTELVWGSFDHTSPGDFDRIYPDERGTIDEVLGLLDRYEIAATWAVLGHLFLHSCRRADGVAHSELVHPEQSWRPGDWFSDDPCTDRATDPLWYGDDILDAIQAAGTSQEIGCHSFSHALFDDPALTEAAVRSDLEACVRLAGQRGIELRSFVFPRNREGHHVLLREAGFTAFRGADPTWHAKLPGPASRIGHLVDQAVALPPPISTPFETLPGLWNIPGSMLLMHRVGVRRFIPASSRIRKARRALREAARTGGTFHLWTHPFNLSHDRPVMLAVLDSILRDAARLRDTGRLRIEPMGTVAERSATEIADRTGRLTGPPETSALTEPVEGNRDRP